MKKFMKVTFLISAFAALGGCVAVPVGPGYYSGGPGYYGPPAVYGPSIGIGVYGGGRHHWR